MSEVFDGTVEVQDGSGNTTVLIDGANAYVGAGGGGLDGAIDALNAAGLRTVHLSGNSGVVAAGGGGSDGSLIANDAAGISRVTLAGPTSGAGGIYIQSGDLNTFASLLDVGSLKIRQRIGADLRDVFSFVAGGTAPLTIGAEDRPGDLRVRDGAGNDVLRFDASLAALYVGAEGNEGDILLYDVDGRRVFHVDGNTAAVYIGAEGNEGDIRVHDGEGRDVLRFDGNLAALRIGNEGNEGDVYVYNDAGDATIHLDGETGVMSLVGADCAEDFAVRAASEIEAGTVLVIDDAGCLRESEAAYDRRVAGVVSGAGSFRPGIRLDQQSGAADRRPVALMGKVYCKVDAEAGAIAVGDLLTSSDTPGHAMKAADPRRAFGAVIGKALAPFPRGRGLIPILVALQ